MKFPLSRKKESNTVDQFNRTMPSLFDTFFDMDNFGLFAGELSPAVDIEDKGNSIVVRAELPGIEEKDLNVSIRDNYLTIKGEKSRERKEEKNEGSYILSERSYGSFSRAIPLPEGIKKEKITADYKKGVLKITLPREKSAEPKKISIEVH